MDRNRGRWSSKREGHLSLPLQAFSLFPSLTPLETSRSSNLESFFSQGAEQIPAKGQGLVVTVKFLKSRVLVGWYLRY